jgi:branched-chain amino acid transport system permease protein
MHYYLAVALFIFIFGLCWIITRSDTGKIFTAIRESEDAVESAGFNPAKYKVYAMLLSAAMGGLAGAVFVHTAVGGASPSELLQLVVMIDILLAGIVGGLGTISGAVVGGLGIFWTREWLFSSETALPVLGIPVSEVYEIVFFVLLLGMLYLLAEGVLPWAVRQGTRLRLLVRGEDPSYVAGSDGNPWFERRLSAAWSGLTGSDETNGQQARSGGNNE